MHSNSSLHSKLFTCLYLRWRCHRGPPFGRLGGLVSYKEWRLSALVRGPRKLMSPEFHTALISITQARPMAHPSRVDVSSYRTLFPFFLIIAVVLLLIWRLIVSPGLSTPTKKCPEGTSSYWVQPGDNCWEVSRQHGWTLDKFKEANPKVVCDPLMPGTSLCLPPSKDALERRLRLWWIFLHHSLNCVNYRPSYTLTRATPTHFMIMPRISYVWLPHTTFRLVCYFLLPCAKKNLVCNLTYFWQCVVASNSISENL